MAKKIQITRICSVCGVEKPIAAFLQISSKQGTHYGFVCSTCRSMGKMTKPTPAPTEDESTTASTDKRIGAKERLYIEQEKQRYLKELKELHIKEAKKREQNTTDKTEQTELKEKAEKEHRKYYIEGNKIQGFLGQKRIAAPLVPDTTIEHIAKQDYANQRERQSHIETITLQDLIKQELQVSLDFSKPYVAGQTDRPQFQSGPFVQYLLRSRADSPLLRTLQLLYGKHNMPTQAPKASVNDNERKARLEEHIQAQLAPSIRRR